MDTVSQAKPAARILATTNRKLLDMIKTHQFRADLFYRLQGHLIRLPPLRQRPEDIPLLVEHFCRTHSQRLKRPTPTFSPAALATLQAYDWPDNMRQLASLVKRAVLNSRQELIEIEDIRRAGLLSAGASIPLLGKSG
jgi:DNA-binding NtrC family response regulator